MMTKGLATSAAAALIVFTACALSAQTAKASSNSDKPKLLPGLDTRLIDTTADPCVDFFQYACGNFNKLYPIPSDRSSYGTGAMIFDYTENVLQVMLDKAAAGGSGRSPSEQKIGDYYASCMDTATIEKNGLKPLQPDLDRIAGLRTKDELPELLAHLQLISLASASSRISKMHASK
jgi:putative endopeptidase